MVVEVSADDQNKISADVKILLHSINVKEAEHSQHNYNLPNTYNQSHSIE